MKPKELDTVRVLVPLVENGVSTGDVGVIVSAHTDPYEVYEVEIIDEDGYTIALVTLKRAQFEVIATYHRQN